VCGGLTGRYDVAVEMLSILGLSDLVTVTPVQSSYWGEEYFAERPPSERLVNKKLDLRDLNIMRDWRICLKEYLDTYYDGYL